MKGRQRFKFIFKTITYILITYIAFDIEKNIFSGEKKPENSIGNTFLRRIMWGDCSADLPEIEIYHTVIYVRQLGSLNLMILSYALFPYIKLSTFSDLEFPG